MVAHSGTGAAGSGIGSRGLGSPEDPVEDQLAAFRAWAAEHDEVREKHIQIVNRRLILVAVFLVLAFLLLAYRSEANARNITESRYLSCVSRYNQLSDSNTNVGDLGQAVLSLVPNATQQSKDQLVAALLATKTPLPDCAGILG